MKTKPPFGRSTSNSIMSQKVTVTIVFQNTGNESAEDADPDTNKGFSKTGVPGTLFTTEFKSSFWVGLILNVNIRIRNL